MSASLSAAEIRTAWAEAQGTRARDFCDMHGLSEAALIAAHCGDWATRIDAGMDNVMGAAEKLGTVMALTRNPSCVHERVGKYENYKFGARASIVFGPDIDLRMFNDHWVHAFMVELPGDAAPRRSIQVFDAAGDAVHKIHLRPESDHAVWDELARTLPVADQGDTIKVGPRAPVEKAKSVPERADELRAAWDRMTDTHQFMRLASKSKMNRLGAYRVVGAPYVRPLAVEAVNDALKGMQAAGQPFMIFVGNQGCIQIHTGKVETLKEMGPWQNVMDPTFNLHLRLDHIAEVYEVTKPTRHGSMISVEAFDAEEGLILQMFGTGKADAESRQAWHRVVAELPSLAREAAE